MGADRREEQQQRGQTSGVPSVQYWLPIPVPVVCYEARANFEARATLVEEGLVPMV
jgi:hypothetical protein